MIVRIQLCELLRLSQAEKSNTSAKNVLGVTIKNTQQNKIASCMQQLGAKSTTKASGRNES